MPYPLPIFKILTKFNVLRVSTFMEKSNEKASFQNTMDLTLASVDTSQRLWRIFADLMSFDPQRWATNICAKYETASENDQDVLIIAWTNLARSYQCAAILYVLRSSRSPYLISTLSEECNNFFRDSATLLQQQKESLNQSLDKLLRTSERMPIANVRNGSDFWKFVFWPLFIQAYEVVGWGAISGRGTHSRTEEVESVLNRLHRVGSSLGANALLGGAKLLQSVDVRRRQSKCWNWDDAFQSRCVFYV